MKKKVIVFSGIPGCGKTTLSRKIFLMNPLKTLTISNDKIREMITSSTEENVNETFKLLEADQLRDRIIKYRDIILLVTVEDDNIENIIVDATHFTKESREIFDVLSKNPNVEVINVLLSVDKHIAHARTQKRVRTINMETIEKISDGLDSLDVTYDFVIKDDESEKQFLATL